MELRRLGTQPSNYPTNVIHSRKLSIHWTDLAYQTTEKIANNNRGNMGGYATHINGDIRYSRFSTSQVETAFYFARP